MPRWPTGSSLSRYLRPSASTTWNPSAAPRSLPLTMRSGSRGAIPGGPAAIASGGSGARWLRGQNQVEHGTSSAAFTSRAGPRALERQRAIDLARQIVARDQRRVELAEVGRAAAAAGTSSASCSCHATGRSGNARSARIARRSRRHPAPERRDRQRRRAADDRSNGRPAGHAHVRGVGARQPGSSPARGSGAGCGSRAPRRFVAGQAPVPARDARPRSPSRPRPAPRCASANPRRDSENTCRLTSTRPPAAMSPSRTQTVSTVAFPLYLISRLVGRNSVCSDRGLHRVVEAVLGGLRHRDHDQRRHQRDRAVAAQRHRRAAGTAPRRVPPRLSTRATSSAWTTSAAAFTTL